MIMKTPVLSVVSLVLLATLTVVSANEAWAWGATSSEDITEKHANNGGATGSDEAKKKSGSVSFPGTKKGDDLPVVELKQVSQGISLLPTKSSVGHKDLGIPLEELLKSKGDLNAVGNPNAQINPRKGKSLTQAVSPATDIEGRFGKKLCKWSGWCKGYGKDVDPSEVVYVQPVKIKPVGEQLPAIVVGKGGLQLPGGYSQPAPYFPPPPVQHHHDHHHHHKKKKHYGYGSSSINYGAPLGSSSSGAGYGPGPLPGVPYARDDSSAYYDSVETAGGARVQGGGASQSFQTQYSGISTAAGSSGYGAPQSQSHQNFGSQGDFSKRGPRQQFNNAPPNRGRPSRGPGVNPQVAQVQAQVAQAQYSQQQQQQFQQYQPQLQQPYPQQNFGPNPAYQPQPQYPQQNPVYQPQPQYTQQQPSFNQPAYLPPVGKSNDQCICVPASQCAPQDTLGRESPSRPPYQYNQLDPRNKQQHQEQLSEYTEFADGLSEDVAAYYDTESRAVKKDDAIEAEDSSEGTRKKRDAGQEGDIEVPILSPAEPESRQLSSNGVCGPYEVCCRNLGINKPSNNGQCGVRYARGITGRVKTLKYVDGDAEFGEYPWQAAILKKEGVDNVYVCGGSLIDGQHIATAAHCIKGYNPNDLRVRLGEWDVNHDTEFYPHVETDVAAVVIHPEFYAGSLYNDIALLRLESYVDFTRNPHVSPVCLPNQYSELPAGYRCWTTGWGKDAWGNSGQYQNILKEVDVPLVQHHECENRLQSTRLGVAFNLHEGFLCAGGEAGKDACKGDGGGPLVCDIQGTWQLAGIVSWGIGCGQQDVPGVYVKVANYLPWIQSVTRSTLG